MAATPIRVMAMLEALSITGSAKAVLEFARQAACRPTGFPVIELSILSFRRDPARVQPVLSEAIRKLGVPWVAVEERGRFDCSVMSQLRGFQQQYSPDVVWSNSVKSHFLVRLARLPEHCGWMAFHHGYTATDLKMRLYNQLDRWSLPQADCVLTVCRPFAAQLRARGVAKENIRVRHMPLLPAPPVESSRVAALRHRLGLGIEEKIVLAVGRLSKEKGHQDLLRAFARVRANRAQTMRLILVGEGPERENLVRLARKLGLGQSCILAGYQDDVRPFYEIAHLFVLPSHSEGSPNVLLEAISAGIPIVATAVGGVPEIVENGRSALLAPESDVDAMAMAISRLLEETPLRGELTTAARAVLTRHTPLSYFRGVAGALETAFRSSLARRRPL